MTSSISTHVTGPATPDGSGELMSVKRAAIVSMELTEWHERIYDPADLTCHIGWGPANYAVLVAVSSQVRVRVQTYSDRQDAIDYITADPDGYLS